MCEICNGKSPRQARREMLRRIAKHDYTKVMVRAERHGRAIHPSFTYSVGLWEFHSAPELIIVGLHDHAPAMVDAYAKRVKAGEQFTAGQLDSGIDGDYPVLLQPVDRSYYEEWLAQAYVLYPNGNFPALQLVWPNRDGAWPWEDAWAHCEPQPVLTGSGLPDTELRRLLLER